jgi:hypothetical protein
MFGYLAEHVSKPAKKGSNCLIPSPASLDRYVAGMFRLLVWHTKRASALMQYLPLYLSFLVEHGLAAPAEATEAERALAKVAADLAKALHDLGDPPLAADVERGWAASQP